MMRRLPVTLWAGSVLIAMVVLLALWSWVIGAPYDPVAADATARLQGASAEHIMGTDRFGRDIFSIILGGAQVALSVGVVAALIALLVGTPLGMWAAIRRGWVQGAVTRSSDVIQAFPSLLLAIVFAAVFGASPMVAAVAIGIGAIPGFVRMVRAVTARILREEYITAARAAGRNWFSIAWRHVLPNLAGLLLVEIAVTFSIAILAESALSYLGLGTPAPEPSWGRMLYEHQVFIEVAPMTLVWPGLAIAISVLGLNLFSEGLRDVLQERRS